MQKCYLLKLLPEWLGGKDEENGGGIEYKYDILKKFCKCYNVPPASATIKDKIKFKNGSGLESTSVS
jgi:hypothetical protein